MLRRAPEKILFVGLLILVFSILSIFFITYKLSRKVDASNILITHNTEVQIYIQKILSASIENETSATNYALTGLDIFLHSLQQSETNITNNVIALKNINIDHPSQKASFDSLMIFTQKCIVN
ncbi:MAG: CHASE3 domain-containing protein, partial [Ferruginibacter sp.]